MTKLREGLSYLGEKVKENKHYIIGGAIYATTHLGAMALTGHFVGNGLAEEKNPLNAYNIENFGTTALYLKGLLIDSSVVVGATVGTGAVQKYDKARMLKKGKSAKVPKSKIGRKMHDWIDRNGLGAATLYTIAGLSVVDFANDAIQAARYFWNF